MARKKLALISKMWEAWAFPFNYPGVGSSVPKREPRRELLKLQKVMTAAGMAATSATSASTSNFLQLQQQTPAMKWDLRTTKCSACQTMTAVIKRLKDHLGSSFPDTAQKPSLCKHCLDPWTLFVCMATADVLHACCISELVNAHFNLLGKC